MCGISTNCRHRRQFLDLSLGLFTTLDGVFDSRPREWRPHRTLLEQWASLAIKLADDYGDVVPGLTPSIDDHENGGWSRGETRPDDLVYMCGLDGDQIVLTWSGKGEVIWTFSVPREDDIGNEEYH